MLIGGCMGDDDTQDVIEGEKYNVTNRRVRGGVLW